jgi:polyhydroxybutyrate depolymerase
MSCENASGSRTVDFTVCCGEGVSGEGGEEEEEEEEEGEVETGLVEKSITHGGKSRKYILYVPEDWSAGMPLLLNLHGYTMTAEEQIEYGDFRDIADTNGFIIAHPQGTKDIRGNTCWNVGWVVPPSIPFVGGMALCSADDVGFLTEMISEIGDDYSTNPNSVFSTGMSNGGFMSYHLACQGMTAGIASVTGSMSDHTYANCSASGIPVLDIHGTDDSIVAYDGSTIYNVSTPEVVAKWVDNNGLNETPATSVDGDITHDIYAGGSPVEHYKIDGWGHEWPDWASTTVWDFFKRFVTSNPEPPEPPTTPPDTTGKVESSKVAKHIGDTYWDLLEPDNEPKGKTDLRACCPAIASPCDAPPC